MKTNKPAHLPRFPRVLWQELDAALSATDSLGLEQTKELLARYRRNRLKYIATWGVTNIGAKVEGLESIPLEHLRKIERLDEAFQKLHKYRQGGAGDYIAVDVERVINRLRAQQPRSHKTGYEEIGRYLHRRGYMASDNKKALVADAASYCQVSESTVRRAIRALGLTGKKSAAT